MNVKQLIERLKNIEDQETEVLVWSHRHQNYVSLLWANLQPTIEVLPEQFRTVPRRHANEHDLERFIISYS